MVAALVLLLLLTGLSHVMAQIPRVALAAVMMIVAIKTVDWKGVRPAPVNRAPVAETLAMVVTVVLTVWTGNLALAVVAGVLAARCAAATLSARLVRQPE